MVVLWGLKSVERLLATESRAVLTITLDEYGPQEEDIRDRIGKGVLRVGNSAVQIEGKHRRYVFDVTDVARRPDASIPPHIEALASEDGVTQIVWRRRE